MVPSPQGGPQYVSVTFYDERSRQTFLYDFQRIEGRMFLQEVWSWTYADGGDDSAVLIETRSFKPEGLMHWRSNDRVARVIEEFDAPADVSSHWEPVPVFDEWESIARFER